jgi:hypothetical protein
VDVLVDALTRYGIPGIVLAVFIVLYVRKDADLKRETSARIQDAKDYNVLALKLQSDVLTAVDKLEALFNAVRTRP